MVALLVPHSSHTSAQLVFWNYLIFSPFLSYNNYDRCRTTNFYCYWETELMSPSHGVSCWYLFFFFLNPSFQQPCLLFIAKATAESFKAAGSCGYSASYKHSGFLPSLPCYIRLNHGIPHRRDPRMQSCHNSV